ncbi:MAG TPA: GIY-YIG nuclease family protein [Candidatus Acidoferrales bacterium]|nr:GIY-YIG nuclease family protein [Candidatus Acidoferrales bacterium]
MEYSRSSYLSLPSKSGVYVYSDKEGNVLYVGKANDLKSRVSSYFAKSAQLGTKTVVMVSQVEKITITIVESELEALLLEAFYIKKFKPKYNIRLTDNKSYVRIRITVKDEFPKVLLARREDDPKSVYFGPFPSSSAVGTVLKTIRRVFPYQSVFNHPKRICLYHHLGLCPCPPMFQTDVKKRSYRKNIRGIIRILEGESRKIMKELEKERDVLSKKEEYEEALTVQKQINALSLITTPFHKPFEYAVNPNLRIDIRQKELDGLMDALNANKMHIKKLERIECYDISNIQGTNATGSMVVLTHGEIDKSQYRKFKIKRKWDKRNEKDLPNDFAMMKEVLQRRLRHEDWHFPDLIIVDGGKGQVSSGIAALAESGVEIPLVGLAKREETIVIPVQNTQKTQKTRVSENQNSKKFDVSDSLNSLNFNEVVLPKNSPSLHLIQRIRDEAHRFAITYHRKLRSGSALDSS